MIAEYPARLITRNPIPERAIPKAKQNVALQHLYPNEHAKALAVTETDVGYRLLVGLLHRLALAAPCVAALLGGRTVAVTLRGRRS